MIDEQKLAAIRRKAQILAALSLVAFFALIGLSVYKLIAIRREIRDLENVRAAKQAEIDKLDEQKKLFEQEAERSTRSLKKVIESSPQTSQLPPRVYLQINDESQREKANQVAELLQKQGFIVPGVENVSRKSITTTKTDVRFYTDNPEGAGDLSKIKAALKQVEITPLERPLGNTGANASTKVRPRHYEVWFGKDF
ncbi:MAG TPA: hypothetical protein VKA60_24285 [Blastocatellia bacterium]|nr:hypothetical protein [Blastocatellia bacterium]